MHRLALALVLIPALARAAPDIDELCPNATSLLASIAFPASAPSRLSTGTAVVDFTVGTDGSVSEPSVHSSSDPAFDEAARALVSGLSCMPQTAATRLRLPMDFKRPFVAVREACSNVAAVLSAIDFPRAAYDKGLDRGEVLVEFKLTTDGQIPEFYVLRSTHETFTMAAVRGLAQLQCKGIGKEVRVRVPFAFRLVD